MSGGRRRRAVVPLPSLCRLVTSRQAGEFKFDPKGPWQPMAAAQVWGPGSTADANAVRNSA